MSVDNQIKKEWESLNSIGRRGATQDRNVSGEVGKRGIRSGKKTLKRILTEER